MGCANCANSIPSKGLVVISEQTFDAKTPSIDKVFPSSNTNSTTDEANFPIDNSHLKFSFPDVFPSTAMLKQITKRGLIPLDIYQRLRNTKIV